MGAAIICAVVTSRHSSKFRQRSIERTVETTTNTTVPALTVTEVIDENNNSIANLTLKDSNNNNNINNNLSPLKVKKSKRNKKNKSEHYKNNLKNNSEISLNFNLNKCEQFLLDTSDIGKNKVSTGIEIGRVAYQENLQKKTIMVSR
jgi:hypothetical protein